MRVAVKLDTHKLRVNVNMCLQGFHPLCKGEAGMGNTPSGREAWGPGELHPRAQTKHTPQRLHTRHTPHTKFKGGESPAGGGRPCWWWQGLWAAGPVGGRACGRQGPLAVAGRGPSHSILLSQPHNTECFDPTLGLVSTTTSRVGHTQTCGHCEGLLHTSMDRAS